MKEVFRHEADTLGGVEEEDGATGQRGFMFLSEEAALQTDSSVSTSSRLKPGF